MRHEGLAVHGDNHMTCICFAGETPSHRGHPSNGLCTHRAECSTGRGGVCSGRLNGLEISSRGDIPHSAAQERPGSLESGSCLRAAATKEVFEFGLMAALCLEVIVYGTFKASSLAGCDLRLNNWMRHPNRKQVAGSRARSC